MTCWCLRRAADWRNVAGFDFGRLPRSAADLRRTHGLTHIFFQTSAMKRDFMQPRVPTSVLRKGNPVVRRGFQHTDLFAANAAHIANAVRREQIRLFIPVPRRSVFRREEQSMRGKLLPISNVAIFRLGIGIGCWQHFHIGTFFPHP